MRIQNIILTILFGINAVHAWGAKASSGFNWFERREPSAVEKKATLEEFQKRKKELKELFQEYVLATADGSSHPYDGKMLDSLELSIAKIRQMLLDNEDLTCGIDIDTIGGKRSALDQVCMRVLENLGRAEGKQHLGLLQDMITINPKLPWYAYPQNLTYGFTPLHWACRVGENIQNNESMLIALLQLHTMDPYIHVTDNWGGYGHNNGATALHQAIRTQNEATFYLLLLFMLNDYENNTEVIFSFDKNPMPVQELLSACPHEHAEKIKNAANNLIKFIAEIKTSLESDDEFSENIDSFDENKKQMWQALIHLDEARRLDRLGFDERLQKLLSQKLIGLREILKIYNEATEHIK